MKNQLAAAGANGADQLIQNITGKIVNPLIIVMFAFALVGFLWGIRAYITNSDDHEARVKGTTHIMWGFIGMFLMVAAFTIVHIVLNTFGLAEKAPEVNNIIGG
ncbi:MAG: hypothetical protein V4438_04495 [Patescibacteria group bacterium]